jgi:uncharacterized membrane protein (UPF0136 family)
MLGTLLSTTLRMFGPTAAGGVIGWLIGRANDHGKVGLLIGTVVGAVLAAILVWLQLRKLDTKGRA